MSRGRGFNSHPVHFLLRGNYGIELGSFLVNVGQNQSEMPMPYPPVCRQTAPPVGKTNNQDLTINRLNLHNQK
jgi:hypothetical protein